MELFSLLAKLTLDANDYYKALNQAENDANDFDIETPTLDLDKDEFDGKVTEVEERSEGFGATMRGIFDGIKGALVAAGIVGAIAGIVNGIKEAVNLTAQTADGIDKGAARLNISRRKYQEWDHALRQSGASINDLQKGVIQFNSYIATYEPGAVVKKAEDAAKSAKKTAKDLNDTSEEAESSADDMSTAFARLGVNVADADGKLKNTEQLMEETLIALAGFGGSKEERGALVTALFGRGATSLNALLDSGVDGVKELLAEANDLGLVMSDEEITNAVAYGDAVANLQEELTAIKTAFVKDIIPVLTGAVNLVTSFLTKLNPRVQNNNIFQIIDQIDKKSLAASVQVDKASGTAKKLIEDLQALGDYWSLDEEGRMTWDALASKALELFPQLSEYIDTDGKKINGNTLAIEQNIDAWARLEKQRLLSSAMDEKSKAIAEQLTKAYEKGAEASVKQAEAEAVREEAIKEVNKWLNEEGKSYRKSDLFNKTGVSLVQGWNFDRVMDFLTDYEEQVPMGKFLEYDKVRAEVESMREEADKMIEDAEKAQSELDVYQEKLAEQMGLTQAEIIKSQEELEELKKKCEEVPTDIYTTHHLETVEDGYPNAIGNAYVPYDNYPALLHRGERVLTATEARRGSYGTTDYAGLEDRIISAIRAGMADAQVTAVVTDRQVATGSNRYNGNEIDAGRFRP